MKVVLYLEDSTTTRLGSNFDRRTKSLSNLLLINNLLNNELDRAKSGKPQVSAEI